MQDDDSSGHVWREEAAKRRPLAQDAEALGRLIKAARKRAAPARPRPAGDLRPASAGPAGH